MSKDEDDRDLMTEGTIEALLALSMRLHEIDGALALSTANVVFHRSIGLTRDTFIRVITGMWDQITDEQSAERLKEAELILTSTGSN